MKINEIAMVVAVCERSKGKVYAGQIKALVGYSRRLHTLAERDCNVGLTPAEERLEARIIERAAEVAKELGATLYRQGDPRGAQLYLIFPGDVAAGKSVDSYYTNGVAIY